MAKKAAAKPKKVENVVELTQEQLVAMVKEGVEKAFQPLLEKVSVLWNVHLVEYRDHLQKELSEIPEDLPAERAEKQAQIDAVKAELGQ